MAEVEPGPHALLASLDVHGLAASVLAGGGRKNFTNLNKSYHPSRCQIPQVRFRQGPRPLAAGDR